MSLRPLIFKMGSMDKNNINKIINDVFPEKKILVMGDIMVDEYITGRVSRISPEAPVPVLNYQDTARTAGGASNVVNNIRGLGAFVYASGIAANDTAGLWLREYLNSLGVDTGAVFEDGNRPTTIKTRYATKGQQLLRVDNEVTGDILPGTKDGIIEFIKSKISELDAIVLSDYCKGMFEDADFVKNIIRLCNDNNIFISIDSKSGNLESFKGADVVKPNNLELEAAVGVKIVDDDSLERAGRIYLERSGAKAVVVTRGAKGISIFENNKDRRDYKATEAAQVFDVTGAGDTVISTVSVGVVSGLSLDDAVVLANKAAGIVISKVGTAPITARELLD